MVELRQYQQEAIAAVERDWAAGERAVLVVQATGGGKTNVFCAIIARNLGDGRALLLVHRRELVEQARDRLCALYPELASMTGIVMAEQNDCAARIVFGTVQSLVSEERLASVLEHGPFTICVCDEAHHFTSSSYRVVMSAIDNPALRVLGVTATPVRADETGLVEVFSKVSATHDIKTLLSMGYLVPPRWLAIATHIDIGNPTNGDYTAPKLAQVFETDNCLDLVVESHKKFAAGRQAIAFVSSVEGAHRLADKFNAAGIPASSADANTRKADRARILNGFKRGETQVLCNMGLYTEGLDVPAASCIHQVRPTKSDGLYCIDRDTEILSKRGWLSIGSVIDGELVAGFDTATGNIKWVPSIGQIVRKIYLSEKMFSLSSPSLDIRVTEGHRMIYGAPFAWSIKTANELSKHLNEYKIPVAGNELACGAPITDDEIRFIAWFITDGSKHKTTNQIVISQAEHQSYNSQIVSMLIGCGFKYSVYRVKVKSNFNATSDNLRYTISKGKPRGRDKNLSGWERLEPYIDKNLSPLLDAMTERQMEVFLETMHFGDGSKQNGQTWTRRSYHITTGDNKTLADNLQSLCVRRGWRCNLAIWSYNQKPLYMLHIKHESIRCVGGMTSHHRDGRASLLECSYKQDELVWCIQNELGTIVTRRNGKVAILGNCQMVGRGLRPYPGKTDCLILDYAPADSRQLIFMGDVLGAPRRDAVVAETPDEDGVLGGFTFDRDGFKWLKGKATELIARQLDYLNQSIWQWYRAPDGSMSLGLGQGSDENERTLFISADTPPRLWAIGKRKGEYNPSVVKLIAESEDFDSLMIRADEISDRWGNTVLARKAKKWRREPASEAQLKFARRLGASTSSATDGANKGELAERITHALAARWVEAE